MKPSEYYKNRLPHFQPLGALYFVTFRLHNSIPWQSLDKLQVEFDEKKACLQKELDSEEYNKELINLKMQFIESYNEKIDSIKAGPNYFNLEPIAQILVDQLHAYDGIHYQLLCYVVMSNHVHMIIDTNERNVRSQIYLQSIMKKIKGTSARYCNIALEKNGQFWSRESFDVLIRNDAMYRRILNYILANPVKANIVDKWQDYKWIYVIDHYEF